MTCPAIVVLHRWPGERLRLARMSWILAVTALALDIFPASRLVGIDEGFAISGDMARHAVVAELIAGGLESGVGASVSGFLPECGLLRMAHGTGDRSEELRRWLEGHLLFIDGGLVAGRGEKILDDLLHRRVTTDVGRQCHRREIGDVGAGRGVFIPDADPRLATLAQPQICPGQFRSLTTRLQQYRALMQGGLDLVVDPGVLGAVAGVGLHHHIDTGHLGGEAIDIGAVDVAENHAQVDLVTVCLEFGEDRRVWIGEGCSGAVLVDEALRWHPHRPDDQHLASLAGDDGRGGEGGLTGGILQVGAQQWKLHPLLELHQLIESEGQIMFSDRRSEGAKEVVGIDQQQRLLMHLLLE